MLVGDSITSGLSGIDTGYRCELWSRLAPHDVDLVGFQSSSAGCGTPDFDPDHEGKGGATTIARISEMENPSVFGGNSFELAYDVALVHIGTNDKNGVNFGWDQTYIDEIIEPNFRLMIAKLRENNPGVTILVGQLIPCAHGPDEGTGYLGCNVTHDGGLDNDGNPVEGLNEVWARIAADSSTLESPIVLVDHRVGFETPFDLLPDGVHPNGSGKAKMAENWAQALESYWQRADSVLLVEPGGRWHIRQPGEDDYTFWYGNPADQPLFGDWDGDGIDTPGMYRPGTGFVYLTNTLPGAGEVGFAELEFYFGNPGDQVFSGDWDGDGIDTLGIARKGRIYLRNSNDTGPADVEFWFGNKGDRPFGGDPDGNGIDGVFLYRPSSGFTYFTNDPPVGGVAATDGSLFFGVPSDRFVVGDWDADGDDSVGVYRPSDATVYLRYENTTGTHDEAYQWGQGNWSPTAGAP